MSLTTIPIGAVRWFISPLGSLLSRSLQVRSLGVCGACGEPVFGDDAFLRYRGEYYHASDCIELDPPALRHARVGRDVGDMR